MHCKCNVTKCVSWQWGWAKMSNARNNKARFSNGTMNRLAAEILHLLPENDDDAIAILDLARAMMKVRLEKPVATLHSLSIK